jgi:predicted ester cyclase
MQTNAVSKDVLYQNKELVEGFYEEATDSVRADLISENFSGKAPGVTFDKASFVKSLSQFTNAFSDGRYTNEYSVAEGDRVVTVGIFSGTHMGEFQGIAPTGRKVSIMVVHVDRVTNGKISEHLRISDSAGLMKQLQPPK